MFNADFLLTSLVVVLIPGTGVIYTVSTALFLGPRAGTMAAIGCTAGIVPHLVASSLGLSAILHVSALAFQTVKYAGAAYLIYLAWSMWRDTGALGFDAPKTGPHSRQIFIKGILINILNPKLSIFFLAFLPQFVSAGATWPILQMFNLSAVFMVMTLLIFILYAAFAHRLRTHIVQSPGRMQWLQRSFAAVFAALGVKLAMSES